MSVCDADCDCVPEPVNVCVVDGVALSLPDVVCDGVGVGDRDWLGLCERVCVRVSDTVCDSVGVVV